MKFYKMNNNVYVVDGAKKSCIYDVLNNRLFHVSKEVSVSIAKALTGEVLNEDEREHIDSLEDLSIVVPSDKKDISSSSIKDLFCFPRTLDYAWIELTNKCNLKCIHCYNENDKIKRCSMDMESFVHAVDQLVRYGVKSVQLIGGEPFLINKKLLFEMLAYASSKFETFEVFFNGTLSSKDDLNYIKTNFPNCTIALSLHSFEKCEHEKITQVSGSYDKTIQTIKNLQDLKIAFRYVGIYVDNLDIGKELDFGVPYRQDYIRLTGRGNLKLYNRTLLKEKLITEDKFQFSNLQDSLKSIYSEHCFANYVYVGSDLTVYPCVMERRINHGNLKNKSLHELLDKSIVNMSKDDIESCKECEYRYLCKDCRADSMGAGIKAKPWYCTYDVEKGEWIDVDAFIDNLLSLLD